LKVAYRPQRRADQDEGGASRRGEVPYALLYATLTLAKKCDHARLPGNLGTSRKKSRLPLARPGISLGAARGKPPPLKYPSNMRLPLILALLLAACSKPAPPTITPESASVTQVGTQGLELRLGLSATNPNSVDLSAREISAHVVVDKKYDLGTVTLPNAVTLPAGKATKLDVPVAVKWTDLGALVQLAATQAAVPFSIDGALTMGGDLVSVRVPFRLEGSVPHEQIVNATLHSIPQLPAFVK
jgi:hypothetical protein